MPENFDEINELLRRIIRQQYQPELSMATPPLTTAAENEFPRDIVFRFKAAEMFAVPLADPRTVVLTRESIDPAPETTETVAEREKTAAQNAEAEQEQNEP